MTAPLKIEEKGSALSCGEYDENIDRLLDRSNHLGMQSCDTISDLEICVAELGIILDILRRLGLLELRVDNLEARVTALEGLEDALNNLRDELLALIRALQAQVADIYQSLTRINNLLNSVQSQIDAIQLQLENFILSTSRSLADIYRRLAQIDRTLQFHTSQINTLFSSLGSEVTNRINADNNLLTLLNREIANRITGDNVLQNNLDTESQIRNRADTDLLASLRAEGVERIRVDTDLFNLINTKAPKDSPIFVGQPANFTNGAISITPPESAAGAQVITAGWYHRNINVHITNLNNSINTKAPHTSPVFSGVSTFNGPIIAGEINSNSNIVTTGAFVRLVNPAEPTNVPNMGYLQGELSLKAPKDSPIFSGYSQFGGYTIMHAGGGVATPPLGANSIEIPNAYWVNARLATISTITGPPGPQGPPGSSGGIIAAFSVSGLWYINGYQNISLTGMRGVQSYTTQNGNILHVFFDPSVVSRASLANNLYKIIHSYSDTESANVGVEYGVPRISLKPESTPGLKIRLYGPGFSFILVN